MEYRRLGKTGRDVSVIGFGAWAIGADWGTVDDADSLRALHAAADAGVTLIDTADVYGDGHSERVIRRFLAERPGETFFVATKMGRRAPLDMAEYTPEAFRAWMDRSRENLGVDTLDLVQLHCLPPVDLLPARRSFAALDELVADRRHRELRRQRGARRGGASRRSSSRASPRSRSSSTCSASARRSGSSPRRSGATSASWPGCPLASGLLTGRMTAATRVRADGPPRCTTARARRSTAGETFAGVDYETGLEVVEALRELVPEGATMAQLALRWILMHDGVTATIPGAKTPGAGARERRRRGPGAPARGHDGPRRRALRDAHQAPRPPALVGEPPS